jgi:glycosyltransferase involved in cell wall biosynthesis
MRAQSSPRIGLDVRLAYYTAGGIARYVRHLATDLPSQSNHLFDYTHFYRHGQPDNFSAAARRVDCRTPAHHWLEKWALSAELLPHRIDLWHAPDFIPPAAGYRHTIITVHDLTFLLYPQFLTAQSRRYYNGQIAWAVKRATAISADSQATKSDLMALLGVPPEKIEVIYLGLDAEFQQVDCGDAGGATVLAQHGLRPGYILFVGTFEPRKNVPGLLRAYAHILHVAPDAPPLVLAGRKGWLFGDTHRLIQELRLEGSVRILPEWPQKHLPMLYQYAGVFVLPSHYEGFGFPVLDAMGCGTPAVVANRASLPEIAGDAGLLVDPDNAEGIAHGILRVLDDSQLRSDMVQKGLRQATRFSWANTAAATLALYRRTLEL